MIKFHPSRAMLNDHLAGKLPMSLTVAVSAHIEMCEQCKLQVKELESLQSKQLWQMEDNQPADFGDMLHSIFAVQPETQLAMRVKPTLEIKVAAINYQLPLAFSLFTPLKWTGLGRLNRARIIDNENEVRASLLHIDKGGSIPMHQHKGYELTLLLDGSFADENGTYHKGDFIYLQSDHEHAPFSENGCICYVVQNGPVHFVSGVSKVLNPLVKLLY